MNEFLPAKLQRIVSYLRAQGDLQSYIIVTVLAACLVALVVQQVQWIFDPEDSYRRQQFIYDRVQAIKLRWKDFSSEERAQTEKSLREDAKKAGIRPNDINQLMRLLRRGDDEIACFRTMTHNAITLQRRIERRCSIIPAFLIE